MLTAGDSAPDFSVHTLSGDELSLAKLTREGAVLLAFFKVSCPTCQYTFPFLERLKAAIGLSITGISQDDAKATAEFCRAFGISFPIGLDPAKAHYPLSNAYRISQVPTLFLIEGTAIAHAFSGFSRSDLELIRNKFGPATLFRPGEKIPEFRPG
jgi:peroxiredoxin